jgi:hypothetical protein
MFVALVYAVLIVYLLFCSTIWAEKRINFLVIYWPILYQTSPTPHKLSHYVIYQFVIDKIKYSKVHPRTGYEVQEGE